MDVCLGRSLANDKKATEQYLPMFPFLYDMVLTFESVIEIEVCDYSNEPTNQYFCVVLFIMLHEVILTVETAGEKTKTQQEKKKANEQSQKLQA